MARKFYVSVIDGSRYSFLAGPFDTHREALDLVESVRQKADELDPRAWFYAFGTARAPEGCEKPGLLNDVLGVLHAS